MIGRSAVVLAVLVAFILLVGAAAAIPSRPMPAASGGDGHAQTVSIGIGQSEAVSLCNGASGAHSLDCCIAGSCEAQVGRLVADQVAVTPLPLSEFSYSGRALRTLDGRRALPATPPPRGGA
jgi:hypothetical protein